MRAEACDRAGDSKEVYDGTRSLTDRPTRSVRSMSCKQFDVSRV